MPLCGVRVPSRYHSAVREACSTEIETLRRERERLRSERSSITVRNMEFERRMRSFRNVSLLAWTAVLAAEKKSGRLEDVIGELRQALEASDTLWEGFAGCVRDTEGYGLSRQERIRKSAA